MYLNQLSSNCLEPSLERVMPSLEQDPATMG